MGLSSTWNRLIARDEFGDDYTIKHDIFDPEITDRDKFQRVMLKAAANDNYPSENGAHVRDAYVHTLSQRAELVMDERTSAFVVCTSMENIGEFMTSVKSG